MAKIWNPSDYSMIDTQIIINPLKRGKGIWKFNNNMLYQKGCLALINDIILDEKIKYATSVYSLKFIQTFKNIQFTVADYLCFEKLLLRVRGETVKFSSFQKGKKKFRKRLNKRH